MAARSWKLTRFARYTPNAKDKTTIPWKVYDGTGKRSPVFLTILDSGYLLVMQGQENLEVLHLISSGDSIKICQKSDHLMFRMTLKGESRMTRLQFLGKDKEQALMECASALKKIMEYLPGTCLEDTLPTNQTQTEAHATQLGDGVRLEHQPVQGLLSMKQLAQYFLGQAALTLPEAYHHCPLTHENILSVFLMDPSFHAYVEKVEGELKTLLKD